MGAAVLSLVNALPVGKETRLEILAKHGIVDPQADGWYPQRAWLAAFKDIAEEIGDFTLFSIGKAIPENAVFPPEIDSLDKALAAIDIAYHMNHRNGEIGHYTLTHFDGTAREATMVCNNPYPSEFDRGIIMTMLRRFIPPNSLRMDVKLDITQPTRTKGAESCTYKVLW